MIMLNSGLFLLNSEKAQKIISECKSSDWRIFYIYGVSGTKDEFCSAVAENLPLDPPYNAVCGHNWDALDDSLWGGLDSLSEDKILIIWNSAGKMQNNDAQSFEIVCDIFSNLTVSLPDEKKKENKSFQLTVIGIV